MNSMFIEINGGVVAGFHHTPAKLKISSEYIIIKYFGGGSIKLNKNHIISFEVYKTLFLRGLLINHNIPTYPFPVIFGGNPQKLLQNLSEFEFIPCGKGEVCQYKVTISKMFYNIAPLSVILCVIYQLVKDYL